MKRDCRERESQCTSYLRIEFGLSGLDWAGSGLGRPDLAWSGLPWPRRPGWACGLLCAAWRLLCAAWLLHGLGYGGFSAGLAGLVLGSSEVVLVGGGKKKRKRREKREREAGEGERRERKKKKSARDFRVEISIIQRFGFSVENFIFDRFKAKLRFLRRIVF